MIIPATRLSRSITVLVVLSFLNYGCVPAYDGLPGPVTLASETLKDRKLQTRRYDTNDETLILQSVIGLLQDLGFIIDETAPELGVVVASKDRDARDGGEIALSIFVLVMTGRATSVNQNQKLRASVVTFPSKNKNEMNVRVTFQRVIWNTSGRVTRSEAMREPKLYQEFFSKLSKAVFLEAHEVN
jgi:hypothetical protein